MNTKFAHTAFKVKDIEKSYEFYTKIMGFKEVFKLYNDQGEVSTYYLYISAGQFIELFPGGKGEYTYDPEAAGHAHICYEVEDIEDAARELTEKEIEIDVPVKKGKSGCFQLWIRDPDGNKIEIMELPEDSMQARAKKEMENRT